MEFGFWVPENQTPVTEEVVLILVIMEFGFWDVSAIGIKEDKACLNPCYNGIWFLRDQDGEILTHKSVLILVIMEFGFWA